MIKHTESVLAIKLFERLGGRLHATTEAHQLMEEIEPLFISFEVSSKISQYTAPQDGPLLRDRRSLGPARASPPCFHDLHRNLAHLRV